ncbi:MAG: HlyC/CorC family transporter [Bacteroidaceae bacterium]|nr:HlyC/CorC family transporter [Bacteroidaceae bacterium]
MKEIVIILLLILLNGLFSLSEIALISARKVKLTNEAKRGRKSARIALELAEEPDRFLSTVQIGITLIGILTGIYSGATLADDFAQLLVGCGIAASYSYPIAQVVIVVVVTYLSIVFGELVPKRIGLNKADSMAQIVARPMKWLSVLAHPFVWLLAKSTSLIATAMGVAQKENTVTEEEIKSMIQEGTEAGEVQEVEQDIIERVLVLGDQRITSIMTARKDLVCMHSSMTVDDVRHIISQDLYDAYPVISDGIDDIQGLVALKDLILILDKPQFNLADVVKKPHYFPDTMTVYTALEMFRNERVSRALVVDEFGSIQGLVTMRDILEGLVGSLENSDGQPHISPREDGSSWLVDAMCPFYEFLAYFEREDLYQPTDYATLGGLILDILEHLPQVGEIVTWETFTFEVVDMDGTRIDKLLVRKL